MYRVQFTAEDLARVRLMRSWGPLAETYLSLGRLRRGQPGDGLRGWSTRVARSSSGLVHPCASLFDNRWLDLFTLTGPAESIEEGLTALLAVRPEHLRAELVAAADARWRYGDHRRWPAGVGDPAGNRADRHRLATFLHDYHKVAVAPHWSHIQARLDTEHAALTHLLAISGVEGLLAGLMPFARWRYPVLEVGHGATTTDIHLGGRGLLLVPSAFLDPRPVLWTSGLDEEAPSMLFLPAMRGPLDLAAVLAEPPGADRLSALVDLVGRTRAYALHSIGTAPCTTGELAHRLAISAASASEHATVLRGAGLVSTVRQGRTVRHHLTALGEQMLSGTVAAPSQATAVAERLAVHHQGRQPPRTGPRSFVR
ncbi:ArsR/SmtB family transcription factor [Micromonospora sp. NPDC048063]|uniref:ArsR/SmtB family transcription factor n=1 Tax=Micromonospora sp. NPDC048063 TaxID=3364256 RepID=UPI003720971C